MLGQTLGSYTIERELGRGGMGAVYTAVHTLLGRRAAVKVLLAELSRNQDVVQRFFNEARAATAIKHPSIVEIYDFGWAPDGSAYIVMELMEGESLAARLHRVGRMTVAQALTVTRQIANALAAAHRAGIIHRDLKPDNVFLVPDVEVAGGERVKLLDFGIAKLAAEGQVSRTSTGAIMGTPMYMSPEQCEGARHVDRRTDLYALGCMLFEMITGRVPFVSEGVGGLIGMHLHVPPPALRSLAPDAPAEVEALVARLLAKHPDERYQTADDLAAVVGELLGHAGSPAAASSAQRAAVAAPGGSAIAPTPPPQMAAGTAPTGAGGPAAPTPTGPGRAPSSSGPVAGSGGPWGAPAPGPMPSTLSAASSSLPGGPAAPRSRRGLWMALAGAVVVAGAIVAIVVATSSSGGGGGGGVAGAADAGEEIIDTDPLPPADPLLEPARVALAERRWPSAQALAEDILRKDPDHAEARAIHEQAARGMAAEQSLAEMQDAAGRREWLHVRELYDRVYDQTVDNDPLREQADAIMAEVRPQGAAEARAQVERAVKRHECDAARKRAEDAIEQWGDEARPLIDVAARCKAPSRPPPRDDPPPPPPEAPEDFDKLVMDAKKAAKSGQWSRSMKLCERALRIQPREPNAVLVCAMAACNLQNVGKARRYLGQLDSSRQSMARQMCLRNGVDVDGGGDTPYN